MMYDLENGNLRVPQAEFVTRLLRLPRGISRLEKLGEERQVPKDHMLVEAGEIPKYCYIVKTGRVVCYEFSVGGEERIYNFNENNSLLLESYVLFDTVVPVNFKTTLPSKIVYIDKETLVKAISSDPQICMDVMQSMHLKFNSSMEQIRHANFHNASWKICDLLLMFAECYGVEYDGKVLFSHISQESNDAFHMYVTAYDPSNHTSEELFRWPMETPDTIVDLHIQDNTVIILCYDSAVFQGKFQTG